MIEYRILEEVYKDMVSNRKDTEIRLLNKKSSKIKIGDTIRFKVANNEDIYVDTKVVGLKIYDTIEEVWDDRKNCRVPSTH